MSALDSVDSRPSTGTGDCIPLRDPETEAQPRALLLHPTTVATIADRAEAEDLSYSEALRRLVMDGHQLWADRSRAYSLD
ncbi:MULTISPECIES: hypothetical protein [Actinoalloteichus]|uniref:Uncharacterized protein n=1 Tax=Actinoalloteichus fjordicus TaxID=1612552 RepID=A0AAC9PTY0_9PSEU|nr:MULTISPECIES: hypothetical protein [Actinoalloteichus]APU16628.1 hypothetical protein UA74_23050 [Actinoalloteichus fjordicus]APU22694.1 hypothetical protein UA75_23560 [Actinoalloteichus sp. GBA129-24]